MGLCELGWGYVSWGWGCVGGAGGIGCSLNVSTSGRASISRLGIGSVPLLAVIVLSIAGGCGIPELHFVHSILL